MTHLVPLAGDWQLWRSICLRSAGFPVGRIEPLAARETARIADELLAAEATLATTRREALEQVKRAREGRPATERKPFDKLHKQILAGNAVDDALGLDFAPLRAGHAAVEKMRAQAIDTFEREAPRWREALRAAARDPLLREALAWQNPGALRRGFDALLRHGSDETDFKTRQNEALVASYLSRYALKNDTIGFFGPVGWGELGGRGVELEAGPTLLATRTVYWESWAMKALAERLASDEELRPHLRPRRMPSLRLEGETLHHGIDKQTELDPLHARLLSRCEGVETAQAIAEQLLGDDSLGLSSLDEVYQLLDELRENKLMVWTLELPNAGAHPERVLADELASIPGAAGERARASLARLEAARAAVAAAAGSASALDEAQRRCAALFVEETGAASERASGQAYAGRTLLYEDCRRDVRLRLGEDVLAPIAPALALVLESARWFTWSIAERYRRAFDEIFVELGGGAIGWQRFWARAKQLFVGGAQPGSIVGEVRDQLQRSWADLLALDDERRVSRQAAELRAQVLERFSAPRPGWPSARHHSPDLLIAARSAQAIADGEALFVLGELHVGMNTLTSLVFQKEHPDGEVLIRAREADLPQPGVAPVWSDARTRADFYSLSRHDFDLEVGTARSWRPRAQVLRPAELVIERRDDRLLVRTRDEQHRFDVIAFVEQHLIAESYAHFQLLPERAHSPRVTVDRLVVARESWRFAPGDCRFADGETPAARFVGARRFAALHRLPRRVFVKVPEEQKPVFVDFDAPVLVDAFAKLVRAASTIQVSEMLPGPDECWLLDADGQAYTSELRLAAVDERSF